jgi:hypothetical protein
VLKLELKLLLVGFLLLPSADCVTFGGGVPLEYLLPLAVAALGLLAGGGVDPLE